MANEPEETKPAPRPSAKKLLYKSPLSGIRSAPYQPPVDKSGFQPIGISSPKPPSNNGGDRFAVEVPHQNRPPDVDTERLYNRGPNVTVQRGDNQPNSSQPHPSLGGMGGHWRGPHGNMTPDNRRRGGKQGYKSSPNFERNAQWCSPLQNFDSPCSFDRSGSERSFGHNSYRQKSFGTNSFNSNPRTPNSPYNQFNTSNSPHNNSRRKNRGGSHGYNCNGGIEVYYSPSMKEDPWSSLIRERENSSLSLSRTSLQDSKSHLNLTSDSELDEGISSQGNDTPAGDDSS